VVARAIAAVHREGGSSENPIAEEKRIMEAIGSLQPIWDELYPAEQNRILRLLVERIDVAVDGISITLHTAGIRSLATELAPEAVPQLAERAAA
jgi:riboflavin synthase alpha subunit